MLSVPEIHNNKRQKKKWKMRGQTQMEISFADSKSDPISFTYMSLIYRPHSTDYVFMVL